MKVNSTPMEKILKDQFLKAILAYILVVGFFTLLAFQYLPKIKLANEKYQELLTTYQNLRLKEESLRDSSEIKCDGSLIFQTEAPVTAMHAGGGKLYLSRLDGRLNIIDLKTLELSESYQTDVFTDFYSDSSGLYGADILNDRLARVNFGKREIEIETVYPKIGRISSLARFGGDFYVSGYASGNITKIIGRDGFLFASRVDKVVDLEAGGSKTLLVARYDSKPSLLKIDEERRTIIEPEKIFPPWFLMANLFG